MIEADSFLMNFLGQIQVKFIREYLQPFLTLHGYHAHNVGKNQGLLLERLVQRFASRFRTRVRYGLINMPSRTLFP